VVISASHNPFEDNGIKVFSGQGEKFTEHVEREVEAVVADSSWRAVEGTASPLSPQDLVGRYLEHLRAVIPEASVRKALAGLTLAIDCANGATSTVGPACSQGSAGTWW
jgi:phosphoglucosamine mutase